MKRREMVALGMVFCMLFCMLFVGKTESRAMINVPMPTLIKEYDYWEDNYRYTIGYDVDAYEDYTVHLCWSEDNVNFTQYSGYYTSERGFELYDFQPRKGHTYYFKIQLWSSSDETEYKLEGESPVYTLANPLDQGKLTKVNCKNESSIQVKWDKVSEASGYELYRCTYDDNGNTGMVKYKEFNAATTSFVDDGLTFANTYEYKIIPYVLVGEQRVYGKESPSLRATVSYGPVTGISTKILSVSKIQITWNKHYNSAVKGYRIYRSTSPNGTFKCVKTLSSIKTLKSTITGLSNGTRYYYRICAVGEYKGKQLLGGDSATVSRLMNVLGYADEDWEAKDKRIYGSKGQRKYNTNKNASKNMKTITIKVWDFKDSRHKKKVTKRKQITVNKYLAETYKQIFLEIYRGKEKFPIKDVSSYSFRHGEHSRGTAIDINPWENYLIDGKKILCGKLWKPKKNPYSIPTNGEVAKIMAKYGFSQGLWGDRRDYMHFSYFAS